MLIGEFVGPTIVRGEGTWGLGEVRRTRGGMNYLVRDQDTGFGTHGLTKMSEYRNAFIVRPIMAIARFQTVSAQVDSRIQND
ncbi:hypothetical protein AcV7_004611, partial [Taiwanofungus camphoratus]